MLFNSPCFCSFLFYFHFSKATFWIERSTFKEKYRVIDCSFILSTKPSILTLFRVFNLAKVMQVKFEISNAFINETKFSFFNLSQIKFKKHLPRLDRKYVFKNQVKNDINSFENTIILIIVESVTKNSLKTSTTHIYYKLKSNHLNKKEEAD